MKGTNYISNIFLAQISFFICSLFFSSVVYATTHHTILEETHILGILETRDIDLDNNNTVDCRIDFEEITTPFTTRSINISSSNTTRLATKNSASHVEDLVSGKNVNSVLNWSNSNPQLLASYIVDFSYPSGNFIGKSHMYAPIEFDINGNLHYGWIEFSIASDAASFTIHSYAYETVIGETIKTGGGPLPIQLTRFEGGFQRGYVHLNWITAAELDNDYYTIERSKNGTDFTEVLRTTGQGSSLQSHAYTAIDKMPYGGKSYYRLKQTDFDGSFTYSPIILLEDAILSTTEIKTYPLPVAQGSTVTVEANAAGELELLFYDIEAKSFFSRSISVPNGKLVEQLDTKFLPPGFYQLVLKNNKNKILATGKLLVIE